MQLMFSKSFSFSGQSKIVPYYYKAEMDMESKDITIVTLVTRNRIPNLARLAKKYKGKLPHPFFFINLGLHLLIYYIRSDFYHHSYIG